MFHVEFFIQDKNLPGALKHIADKRFMNVKALPVKEDDATAMNGGVPKVKLKNGERRKFILKLFKPKNRTLTAKEIIEAVKSTGGTKQTAYTTMAGMTSAGLLRRVSPGKYKLTGKKV